MTVEEKKKIMALAQGALNSERIAVQNAEHGNEGAVTRHQNAADRQMDELAGLLGVNRYGRG